MKTYYLKFKDADELAQVYRHPTMDDGGITYPGFAFDIIGLIVDEPAVIEGDRVVSEATYVDGWHVNVYSPKDEDLPEELFQFVIPAPTNPRRVVAC